MQVFQLYDVLWYVPLVPAFNPVYLDNISKLRVIKVILVLVLYVHEHLNCLFDLVDECEAVKVS